MDVDEDRIVYQSIDVKDIARALAAAEQRGYERGRLAEYPCRFDEVLTSSGVALKVLNWYDEPNGQAKVLLAAQEPKP